MEYATIEAFRRDPAKVWDFYAKRLGRAEEASRTRPTSRWRSWSGVACVEAVITQNVDRLHQGARELSRTGLIPSPRPSYVIEVHGVIRTASCLACGHREEFERVLELLPVPACRSAAARC